MPSYDSTAALIVVDLQNDFADPGGSLAVAGGTDIVPVVNGQTGAALAAGALVVFTQDWHPQTTPHFQKDGGVWPVHCVGGTWGSELHPDLLVAKEAKHLRKGTRGEDGYSAFSVRDPRGGEREPTALVALLRERGIRRLVIAGLATDYCVVETVLDARSLGFDVSVLTEAIRAVDLRSGDGDRALERMRESGAELV